MQHDRDRTQIKTGDEYSHGRHIFQDAIRGFVAGTRGWLEGRKLQRDARTDREKRIADEAYRQRTLDLTEQRTKLEELRYQLNVDKFDEAKKTEQAKRDADTAKAEADADTKGKFSKANTNYRQAWVDHEQNPTPQSEEVLRHAASMVQYWSSVSGIESDFVTEELKRLDTEKEERSKKSATKDLKTTTDAFNAAYTAYIENPEDETARLKMLRAAIDLNAIQDQQKIQDPLIEGILKDAENQKVTPKVKMLNEQIPILEESFWDAYKSFASEPDVTDLTMLEQTASELIDAKKQIGEDTSYLEGILDHIRKAQADRIESSEKQKLAESEELTPEDIIEGKKRVNNADYIDDNTKKFITDMLDSGIWKTKKQFNDYLTGSHKAKSAKTGTDTSRSIERLDRYEAEGPNRRFINALAFGQSNKELRAMSIDYLDDIFEGKKFDKLTAPEKDAAALHFLQTDKPPGGEIVQRFMQATSFLQGGLASLYQEYNRITKDGKVKYKLGKLQKIEEGVYQYLAGDISDPAVRAFDSKVGYLLITYIRMVSGAQVTTFEESSFRRLLVSAGNTVDLNDAIFKALDDEIRGQLQGYFTRRTGKEWGDTLGDKVYHEAHDIGAAMSQKDDSRIEPSEPDPNIDSATGKPKKSWSEVTEQQRIDLIRGDTRPRAEVRDDLINYYKLSEGEADRLLDAAGK